MTTKKLKLDIWKKNYVVVAAHKGEVNSRFLAINLVNEYTPLNLENKTVIIYAKKPDGTIIFNDCDITDAQNGIISVKLTSQMSSVIGNLSCEFQILGENAEVLIVQGLIIKILQAEDDVPIQSTSEYAELLKEIHELEDVNQETTNLLKEYQTDNFATKSQGLKADSAIQGIKIDGNLIPPDSENVVSITGGGDVEIKQNLGDLTTAVISQNASTTLLAEKNHSHKVNDLENEYFLTVHTGAKNYINDMIEIPSPHHEAPPTIGMISSDGTNGSFYLQTNDGLNYQKYQIGKGAGFKLTYNSSNGQLYAISGQNVFTAYSYMPDHWNNQTTTSPHDISVPVWYSYENGIFFLSSNSTSASGLWSSTDSLNWELIKSMKNGWYCCKWLDGAYWACGLGVYKSADAINWEQILSPEDLGGSSKWAMNILYINGKYTVMADWGARYLTSTDGIKWTEIIPNSPKPSSRFLIWDDINNLYCSPSSGIYYTSKDLLNWNNVALYGSYSSPNSFMISNGKVFIDYGQQYSGKLAIHNKELPFILPESSGGTGTTSISSLKNTMEIPNVVQSLGTSTTDVMSQNAINNMLVSVTGSASDKVMTQNASTTLLSGITHNHDIGELQSGYVKHILEGLSQVQTTSNVKLAQNSSGTFAFTSGYGIYHTSDQAITWIKLKSPTNSSQTPPLGVICTNSLVRIYYKNGVVFTSTDNQNFTQESYSPNSDSIDNIAFCSDLGIYMAYDNDALLTSQNGLAWTKIQNDANYYSVCANENLFVITGSYNSSTIGSNLRYCEDGINIIPVENFPQDSGSPVVVCANGLFVYLGNIGIYTSNNGKDWTKNINSVPFDISKTKIMPINDSTNTFYFVEIIGSYPAYDYNIYYTNDLISWHKGDSILYNTFKEYFNVNSISGEMSSYILGMFRGYVLTKNTQPLSKFNIHAPEYGTFTPKIETTINPPYVTYTEQSGTYWKLGKLCIASGRITCNISSEGSGHGRITGLPFVSSSEISAQNVIFSEQSNISTYTTSDLAGKVEANTNYITMGKHGRWTLSWGTGARCYNFVVIYQID